MISIGILRGVPAVTLAAGDLEATFLPGVGMLGASLRHRGDELLAFPGGLNSYRAGHVAALPLLAPWANRLGARRYRAGSIDVDLEGLHLHTDENGLPIHGTMTAQAGWEVLGIESRPDAATLEARFDFGARPDLLASFPFPHVLGLEVRLDPAALTLATTVTATGDAPVPVAFGWHPYFRLPGAHRRRWLLHLPRREHLALDGRGLPTGDADAQDAEAEPIGSRTFDDLYRLTGEPALALEGGGRKVTVTYEEGYPYAQVFAPPGREFACMEPMTALTNSLETGGYRTVEPGAQATARFAIRVEPNG